MCSEDNDGLILVFILCITFYTYRNYKLCTTVKDSLKERSSELLNFDWTIICFNLAFYLNMIDIFKLKELDTFVKITGVLGQPTKFFYNNFDCVSTELY